LSIAPRHHDPYWDMDGAGAQRMRANRRVVRYGAWLGALLVLAVVLTQLPAIDPEYLIHGGGRPILAASVMTLLGAAVLLALARVRYVSRH
jgi:hypothetical protein